MRVDQIGKSVEEEACIQRAAAGFGMELYRECRHIVVSHALASAVVSIYERGVRAFGQRRVYNSVAVVLAGDVNSARCGIGSGLVSSSVTVLELFCFCTL